jgi:hypothetical protein
MQGTHDEVRATMPLSDGGISGYPAPTSRPPSSTVGLTFSQQWVWYGQQLGHRASMRIVAGAVRWSGQLNIECLRLSILELMRRHEALRTRIVVVNGIPTQQVEETGHLELDIVDLSGLPKGERESVARQRAKQFVCEPTLVVEDPLFATMLIKLDEREHVLILAMDHLIADAASRSILLREIRVVYSAFVQGVSHSLPGVPVQYLDYAVWQQESHRIWSEKHGGYWNERLAGARKLQLFATDPRSEGGAAQWRMVPVKLGEDLSARLRELSRTEAVNLAMVALTAYVALILRRSDQTQCVVQFMTTGRLYPQINSTVGFFAAPLFLRVGLQENDTLLDLLRRVTSEYRAGREHNDCGAIAAQQPAPDFASNPQFNWHRADFNLSPEQPEKGREGDDLVETTPYDIPVTLRDGMEWDQSLGMSLRETSTGIVGAMLYRADRTAVSAIDRFHREFHTFAQAIATTPNAVVTSLSFDSR